MKRIYWYFVLGYLSILLSCRKDQPQLLVPPPSVTNLGHSLSISEVKQWYDSLILVTPVKTARDSMRRGIGTFSLNWQKAEPMTSDKGTSWMISLKGQPISNGVKQGYRKLLFFRDSAQQIQVNIVEIIPDALYLQRNRIVNRKTFTGKVWVYNQDYQLTGGFLMAAGKVIGNINPSHKTQQDLKSSAVRLQMLQVQSCEWLDDSYINSEGILTIYTYQICTDMSLSLTDGGSFGGGNDGVIGGDYLGNGGGGGGTVEDAPRVAILPGENGPKIDPKKMMDCFGNIPNAGASMKITVANDILQ